MGKLLEIKDLRVQYETGDGIVQALNGIDISLEEGMTLGLVGETGAGKTTLAKSIMRIIPQPPGRILSGEILYDGNDILKMDKNEIRKIRGEHISMIFQDPMTSLNPVMTVGEQIAETIKTHEKISSAEATKRACEMLELVGIKADRAGDYPHQFSGGMKQRVVIAIALACNPKILIADEPTTALDVTIQAQVLEMMQNLKRQFHTATILITHDLGVVAQTCDKVAIMYAGEIIETGTVEQIFSGERHHPYTTGLFESIPDLKKKTRRLHPIDGLMPDPTDLPPGCKFHTRCPKCMEICRHELPAPVSEDGHVIRCHLYGQGRAAGKE